MPDFALEKEAAAAGYSRVCGIDEAGRGPLAGPVCAAAVILPEGCVIDGLNDSKKLSEKKREALFEKIRERAVTYGIAFASVEEIERFNILEAAFLAMRRAAEQLSPAADFALVDGNRAPKGLTTPCWTVVKGDSLSASIAAASILAKVTRDRYMLELDKTYPQYGFQKHKGYGTRAHIDSIKAFGPSPVHRLSFLGRILDK